MYCILLYCLLTFRRAVVFLPQKCPGTWPPKKTTSETKIRAYAVVMVTALYHRFFCYTFITQKYRHYKPIKSLKFLGLYYNHRNHMLGNRDFIGLEHWAPFNFLRAQPHYCNSLKAIAFLYMGMLIKCSVMLCLATSKQLWSII